MWCGIHFPKKHVSSCNYDLQLNAPTVKCEQCDFEGSHTKLLYHKRTKHRAEEITCSLCEELFNNKSKLN